MSAQSGPGSDEQLAWQPQAPATKADRRAMAGHLLDLQRGVEHAFVALQRCGVREGSEAWSRTEGKALADSGYMETLAALVTAENQMHASALLLRNEPVLGAPAITCARGCIEALGRAWYLLAPGETALETRRQILQYGELKHFADEAPMVQDGMISTSRAAKGKILGALGGSVPTPPGYTALATTVMEAAGVREPRVVYSRVSGLAHAEPAHTLALQVADDSAEEGYTTIGLPLHTAQLALSAIVKTVSLVMDTLCRQFDCREATERWTASRERVHQALSPLLDAA